MHFKNCAFIYIFNGVAHFFMCSLKQKDYLHVIVLSQHLQLRKLWKLRLK